MASDLWEKAVEVYELEQAKAFRSGRTILDSRIVGLQAAQQFMPALISGEELEKLKRELLDTFIEKASHLFHSASQFPKEFTSILRKTANEMLAPKPRYTLKGNLDNDGMYSIYCDGLLYGKHYPKVAESECARLNAQDRSGK